MDTVLLTVQLLLGALGVLGVATGDPELLGGHTVRFLGGLLITMAVARLRPRTVVRLSPWLYLFTLLLLALVLVIGISPAGSDSRRWLDLGLFTLQPSELMKVAVVAYLAAFFNNHVENTPAWRPTVVIGVACGFIVLEPDLGTSMFIFLLALGIMFVGPVKTRKVLAVGFLAAVLGSLFGSLFLSDFTYFADRIDSFFDLHGEQASAQDISYQAVQARRTIMRAGFTGIGPGRPSVVPEADTDMVAIAVTQSLGLLGIGTVIVLFVLFGMRGIRIASSLTGPGSMLAAGATIYICGQAGLNLAVASGLLPVTGIPLPFMSYGLNSLLSVSIAAGFIHSAWRQVQRQEATA